jgi:hypothetical protein
MKIDVIPIVATAAAPKIHHGKTSGDRTVMTIE